MSSATFYVKAIVGTTYTITIDPKEKSPEIVCDQIKSQLPKSYNNDNFKVICEGKDLRFFNPFVDGVGAYFSTLASIYVVGNSLCPDSKATVADNDRVKLKLLARLQKFKDNGFMLSREFTMDSHIDTITHELALLHVLKDLRNAESLSPRQCIAHGCGNYLSPDEDLRCKICDY